MRDREIEQIIDQEKKRQKRSINLIASENFVSADVLKALGSELVNKYSEGYPGARYYGGNEHIDQVEILCQKRALKLFKLKERDWAVNVQPYSGSPANLAVYLALVPVGGKIMAMSLDGGGHLTHGSRVSITGQIWQQVSYGVDKKTEQLDYNQLKKIAQKEKPALIVAGFTAYPRKIDWLQFREMADACGAYLLIDMSHIAGLVAGGVHPSPFYTKDGKALADIVTTTTHKTLRGPRAALILSRKDDQDLPKKIDKAVFPGLQGGPHQNQIAAVAVALGEAMEPSFKIYAKQIIKNAKALSAELKKLGWRIVSGGTDNHLLLLDIFSSTNGQMSGQEASKRLEKAGVIVNKNTIPFDCRSPIDPSGIRLGVAAETSRGKTEKDFIKIAQKIDQILKNEN